MSSAYQYSKHLLDRINRLCGVCLPDIDDIMVKYQSLLAKHVKTGKQVKIVIHRLPACILVEKSWGNNVVLVIDPLTRLIVTVMLVTDSQIKNRLNKGEIYVKEVRIP